MPTSVVSMASRLRSRNTTESPTLVGPVPAHGDSPAYIFGIAISQDGVLPIGAAWLKDLCDVLKEMFWE